MNLDAKGGNRPQVNLGCRAFPQTFQPHGTKSQESARAGSTRAAAAAGASAPITAADAVTATLAASSQAGKIRIASGR